MDGEQLYRLYLEVNEAHNVECDAWGDLSEHEQQIWHDLATDVQEYLR